jgi:hypothetical protein
MDNGGGDSLRAIFVTPLRAAARRRRMALFEVLCWPQGWL